MEQCLNRKGRNIEIGRIAGSKNSIAQGSTMAGFTLVELIMVIAIIGIVSMAAIPTIQGSMRNYQINSKAIFWQGVFNYLRSESMKRGERITLCASSNGSSCLAGSKNLHLGWIAFVDLDNDAVRDAPGEEIVRSGNADNDFTFIFSGTGNVSYISFVANGMMKTVAYGSWAGGVDVCLGAGIAGKRVTVNQAGRVKIQSDPC